MNSIQCEHIIMSRFPTLHKNSTEGLYAEYAKLDFCGIITSDRIKTKGGLFQAFACTLALYYNDLDKIKKISKFMDENGFLEEVAFDEIPQEELVVIMRKFKEITE